MKIVDAIRAGSIMALVFAGGGLAYSTERAPVRYLVALAFCASGGFLLAHWFRPRK